MYVVHSTSTSTTSYVHMYISTYVCNLINENNPPTRTVTHFLIFICTTYYHVILQSAICNQSRTVTLSNQIPVYCIHVSPRSTTFQININIYIISHHKYTSNLPTSSLPMFKRNKLMNRANVNFDFHQLPKINTTEGG